ncbi:MAG: hypothetical protein LBV15_03035, partial [Planctomycetota bacterium]|nr:hypothetical protein [Planctomycetota bacterium]
MDSKKDETRAIWLRWLLLSAGLLLAARGGVSLAERLLEAVVQFGDHNTRPLVFRTLFDALPGLADLAAGLALGLAS